ncbi:hypothetical protein QVD17_12655 [Tagetes erecta]|uniref:Uncharacterized protein n=1 Tax=Tagetes erecta TaxID=13708 RepID=A0AAD8KZP1_TARER|nr:hypothetical protein QVD17_12655 [Tagetes erecta]
MKEEDDLEERESDVMFPYADVKYSTIWTVSFGKDEGLKKTLLDFSLGLVADDGNEEDELEGRERTRAGHAESDCNPNKRGISAGVLHKPRKKNKLKMIKDEPRHHQLQT